MKRLSAIATILAATTLVSLAAPRIALIRVKEIYAGLPSTAALQDQVKKERQDIMRSERANVLRRIINELKTLQAQLSDKKKPLDEATARKVARTYEIKRQEAQTLQKEFEDFRSEEEKKINRKLVAAMRESLDRIVTTSGTHRQRTGLQHRVRQLRQHQHRGCPSSSIASSRPISPTRSKPRSATPPPLPKRPPPLPENHQIQPNADIP